MIAERLGEDERILLIGAVRGLLRESYPAVDELERFHPDRVGMGLSPEELRGLSEYFADAEGETTVHLVETEMSEVRALSRWGEVRVPNPTFVRVLEWARHRSVGVAALDPPDEGAADMFTAHVGYVELVRRTLREKTLSRSPPDASTPDEFAQRWTEELSPGAGSRALALKRDRYLANGADELLRGGQRVALVVDRERFGSVRSLIAVPRAEPPRGGGALSPPRP